MSQHHYKHTLQIIHSASFIITPPLQHYDEDLRVAQKLLLSNFEVLWPNSFNFGRLIFLTLEHFDTFSLPSLYLTNKAVVQ